MNLPFPGGIESTSNGTLILSITLALYYVFLLLGPASARRTMAKAGAILLLAVLVFIERGPLPLIAALTLSAIGDAFLAYDGERAFKRGLAAFLAAHIVYVVLFVLMGGGVEAIAGWRIAVALAMIAAVAGLLIWIWRGVPVALRLPVTVYSAAILTMGLTSLTLANPLVILGAVMFMASDGLLATGKFRLAEGSQHSNAVQYAVWALYYAGQATIALAVLGAL